MFRAFFSDLRAEGIPVTLREYLGFLAALEAGVVDLDVDRFYHLARCSLVKDERWFDRFDRVFGRRFRGLVSSAATTGARGEPAALPDDWLRALGELVLDEETRRRIEAMGGFEKLLEELRRRLEEQRERHEGGSKWVGTRGTSPFGAFGYNPEGVRIGQHVSRHGRAVKVWDRREFRDLDDGVELGTRNFKVALRRLRRFVREGRQDELDIDGTIRATARQGGLLDVKMRPERRNRARVVMLFDVGGSMDRHVRTCEKLFSAARAELSGLAYFYFHNCVYESLWTGHPRRAEATVPTAEFLRRFGREHALIFVGDAAMSPYELVEKGGSVEHWNEEPGRVWLQRLLDAHPRALWLNPRPAVEWDWTTSTRMVRELMDGRMHELTVEGLTRGLRGLAG